jgi:hypothetical protein
LTDNDDLKTARHWTDDTALHVVLKPGSAEAFQNDGRLRLDTISETSYYAGQTEVANQLRSLALVVAICLGIGAVFGGVNTMHAAVPRREWEISVRRVLAFSRSVIPSSFLLESASLAAGLIAW